MFSGVLRLLIISALTLIVTFFIVFFVRWVGGQQSFAEPPHPWYQIADWTLVPISLEEICLAKTLPGSVPVQQIVPVTVTYNQDGWVLTCAKPWPLKELLRNSKHPNWLVTIEARDVFGLDQLVSEMAAFNKEKNFGVFSANQAVARYVRKKAPEWLYGADASSLLRFHLYSSLWLETAFDFWPDFVLRSEKDKNTHLNEREERELRRRKKRVIDTR